MKGSTVKRCSCPVTHDSKGRRKSCNKKHGSWSYVIDVGKDPASGQRRQRRKSGFATQAEAQAAMNEVMQTLASGRYRHDDGMTVAAYLDAWIDRKATDYRPTTLSNSRRWLKQTHPHIGSLRLRDLQPGHISAMYRTITTENAERGVGSTTTRRIHQTLRSALGEARREGLIRYNPAADATVPTERKAKVHPWSGEELGQFLDHATTDPFGAIFELMALAGLRRGEALGLRWQDVNLERGFLVVRQQLVSVAAEHDVVCKACGRAHRGIQFGPPKTASGEARRVDLGQAATGMLLEHKLRQDGERAQWQDAYLDHDLVFANVDGSPLRPDRVTRAFRTLVEAAGVRRVRLHDLRHGRASLMLAAGIDMAVVSKMLGHSTVRLTADTYSHLLEGVGQAAAEAADSLIIRKPRDQSVTKPAPSAIPARAESGD